MDAEPVPPGIAVSHDITGKVGGVGCARTPIGWVCPFSVMFGQLLPETMARASTLPLAPICVQVAMMPGDPCAKQEEMATVSRIIKRRISFTPHSGLVLHPPQTLSRMQSGDKFSYP